jgi:hypothetical protein
MVPAFRQVRLSEQAYHVVSFTARVSSKNYCHGKLQNLAAANSVKLLE